MGLSWFPGGDTPAGKEEYEITNSPDRKEKSVRSSLGAEVRIKAETHLSETKTNRRAVLPELIESE